MHVYVDESGDCGFKFAENSSTHFLVTALIIGDPAMMRGLIEGFKAKHRISVTRELKFRSTPPMLREDFFATICTTEFQVVSVVVDKTRLVSRQEAAAFYLEHVSAAVASIARSRTNARLVIDESVKDKQWQGKMKASLRQKINGEHPGCIKEIKFSDASSEPLLQATDMLCGAIRVAMIGRDDRYLRCFAERVSRLISIPAT